MEWWIQFKRTRCTGILACHYELNVQRVVGLPNKNTVGTGLLYH